MKRLVLNRLIVIYKLMFLVVNSNWNRELLPTSGIRAGLSAITPGWGCHSTCQSALSELPASLSFQCMYCMRYNPFTTEFCVLQLCRGNPNPCQRFVCALFCVGANNSMWYPNSSTWRPSFSVINNPGVCHWKPAWSLLKLAEARVKRTEGANICWKEILRPGRVHYLRHT